LSGRRLRPAATPLLTTSRSNAAAACFCSSGNRCP